MKHGHRAKKSKSPTYYSWSKMIERCTNPNHDKYYNYGGKGISVCESWRTFTNFLKDMGERPENKTLDRINPYGNYEPKNCRWATKLQQIRNKRK